MEKNLEPYKAQMKEVVQPSEGVMKSYKNLFQRNQSKWMRRSKMEVSHLDAEFIWEGKEFVLEGSIDSLMMIIREKESGKFYRVHSDLVDSALGLG